MVETIPQNIEISQVTSDNLLTISIKGYADANTGNFLFEYIMQNLEQEKLSGLILDFTGCQIVNSPCVARLYEICEAAVDESRIMVVFCGLTKTLSVFLQMAGLFDIAEMATDKASARKIILENL